MAFRLLALSIAAAAALSAGAALACSCARWESAEAQLRNSAVMFVGRAEETTTETRDGLEVGVTRFTVQRTLKGAALATRQIQHGMETGGMCGVQFQRGRTYTIIANVHEGQLWTGSCSKPQFPLADYERALGLP